MLTIAVEIRFPKITGTNTHPRTMSPIVSIIYNTFLISFGPTKFY